jgi:hypothetical protein
MKLLSIILACLIAAALGPMALTKPPLAAPISNLQGRGLDQYTQRVIKGPAILARAATVRARNRGVARAMGDLERKGLRPALGQGISILELRNSAIGQGRTNGFLKASFQSET